MSKPTRKLATLAIVLFLSASTTATQAQSTKTTLFPSTHSSMLNGVALNAAAATRTSTIAVDRSWSTLRYGIAFTRAAATTVDATVSCTYKETAYQLTTYSCTAGVCTVYERTYSNPQATSANFEMQLATKGCDSLTIVLSGTSAGASDLVTTEAVAVVGG